MPELVAGPQFIHRNADELERFDAKFAPMWSQFAVIGPISELAPTLDRLQSSLDAASKPDGTADSSGRAADHANADPYLSALLEGLESSLKKLDHSLQTGSMPSSGSWRTRGPR
ncbi:MAG: hypothetical protein JO114_21625 [Planctomycetaceae bacterium]|nr:hypothetical protein [Planctomycetaceae bacterium]